VTGEWRKLRDEELRDLYSSPIIIRSRRIRWASHIRKRPLGRPRLRWVDNIKINLGEVGWFDVGWIGLTLDRNRWTALVNSVLDLRVP
jgi:hypothetical protein